MTVYADLGLWVLATLRATPAVTALVMDKIVHNNAVQRGIIEAGDVTAELLNVAQEARRKSGQTQQVLAIVVQDLGEEEFVAQCAVFIYDRYGYANIRAAREAIITALVNQPVQLARGALVNALAFSSRSGHAIDAQFDLDIERIIFSGPLVVERDCYA
jgi:hypothetical protein